jgi:hypothetical protein
MGAWAPGKPLPGVAGSVRPLDAPSGGQTRLLLGPTSRCAGPFPGGTGSDHEAQVGVDVRTLGTTAVRSMLVYLRREEGGWRVALEDFMTTPEVGLPWDLLGSGWFR